MENPVQTVKKAFPTGKFILSSIIAFIVLNLILDALANYLPGVGSTVASFIARPFSTVKALFAKKPASGS